MQNVIYPKLVALVNQLESDRIARDKYCEYDDILKAIDFIDKSKYNSTNNEAIKDMANILNFLFDKIGTFRLKTESPHDPLKDAKCKELLTKVSKIIIPKVMNGKTF